MKIAVGLLIGLAVEPLGTRGATWIAPRFHLLPTFTFPIGMESEFSSAGSAISLCFKGTKGVL